MTKPTPQEIEKFVLGAADGRFDLVMPALKKNREIINLPAKNGWTALMYATAWDRREMVQELLEQGADPNEAAHNRGVTPLMQAAIRGYEELAKMLVENGARVDQPDADGGTALGYAEANSRGGIKDYLEGILGRHELDAEIAEYSTALKEDIPAPKKIKISPKSGR